MIGCRDWFRKNWGKYRLDIHMKQSRNNFQAFALPILQVVQETLREKTGPRGIRTFRSKYCYML